MTNTIHYRELYHRAIKEDACFRIFLDGNAQNVYPRFDVVSTLVCTTPTTGRLNRPRWDSAGCLRASIFPVGVPIKS
jgi:hypothetical protein